MFGPFRCQPHRNLITLATDISRNGRFHHLGTSLFSLGLDLRWCSSVLETQPVHTCVDLFHYWIRLPVGGFSNSNICWPLRPRISSSWSTGPRKPWKLRHLGWHLATPMAPEGIGKQHRASEGYILVCVLWTFFCSLSRSSPRHGYTVTVAAWLWCPGWQLGWYSSECKCDFWSVVIMRFLFWGWGW